MRRALLIGLAAAALAGCDVVTSKTPVFGPADAAKAQPKPGLWAIVKEGCPFNEARPASEWPDKCALAVVIRETDLLLMEKDKGKPPHWNQASYLLAGGDPPIMQTFATDGNEYDFYAVAVDRLDPEGRIVAAKVRALACGPSQAPKEASKDAVEAAPRQGKAAEPAPETTEPATSEGVRQAPLYPGLIATGRTGCTPKGADGLREAAKASSRDEAVPAHWVRDGWR